MRAIPSSLRASTLLLALLAAGVLLLIAVQVVNHIDYRNSDFFSFWLAGRMVWTGQSQYSAVDWIQAHRQFEASWVSDDRFLYPLPLAWFFVPLGILPLYHAFVIWDFLLGAMILLSSLLLLFRSKEPGQRAYILPILAGIIIFRPTFLTLFNGQLGGLLLIVLTGVVLFWEKEKWLAGGLLLSLVALKPNIGVPILLILSFWLLAQKRLGALLGLAAGGLVLLLAGMILNVRWLVEYLSVGSTKVSATFGYVPTLWGLAAYSTRFDRPATFAVGGIAVAAVLTGVLWLIWKRRSDLAPLWAVILAITASLLVTPYSWPYDQLLLIIPMIAIMMEMMSRGYPFLLTAMAFLLLDVVAILLISLPSPAQLAIFSVFVPLVVFCALLWAIGRKGRQNSECRMMSEEGREVGDKG